MAFKILYFLTLNGAPGEIRTPDLLIRSQSLYPAELRAHTCEFHNETLTDYQGLAGGAIQRLSGCGRRLRAGAAESAAVLPSISRPAWRTSLVTVAALSRVASNSTRRVRASGQAEAADAVDIAGVGQRKGTLFGGRRGIAKENLHRGHKR